MSDRAIDFEFPKQILNVPPSNVKTRTIAEAEVLVRFYVQAEIVKTSTVAQARSALLMEAQNQIFTALRDGGKDTSRVSALDVGVLVIKDEPIL